jgi:hypothetical protein
MGFIFPAMAMARTRCPVNRLTFQPTRYLSLFFLLVFPTGCQYQAVSAIRLQIHQSRLNKDGLSELLVSPELNVTCAVPNQWDRLRESRNLFYAHQQWRSPDRHAGMGVAYMHTPVAMSPQTIIWFAKSQYSNEAKSENGRLLGEWSDSLGRSWFEAENNEYHVRGYAMTRGCDAWIVYSGYRVKAMPPEDEIALGEKAAESVAPFSTR